MFALETADPCESGEQICDQVFTWTGNSTAADAADLFIGKPLALLGLLAFGLIARWLLHRVVDRVVSRASDGALAGRVSSSPRRMQRARTMGGLLNSIITGALSAVIVTMMLSELGLNIAPIIASAGVIGLALGFGAQSLVKDFLSGLFMIFEDQYGVGDVVDVGEASGTIEAVGLRVTRLRDVEGTVWYVRNGEIIRVGNMSQNWARTVLDIKVSYREDLTKVSGVLREIAHDLWVDEDFTGQILEEPEVWGVQELGIDAVVVRVTLKTAPLEQWAIAREMRERIKARFDYEKIEIPLPQRVVWHHNAGAPTDAQESGE